jgi:hypothetical protein
MPEAIRHTFATGTQQNDTERDLLYKRLVSQRVDPDRLLEELRERRANQFDFVADNRTLQVVPIPEEHQDQLTPVNELARTELNPPRVALIPKDGPAEEWYEKTGPLAMNAHAHGQVASATPIGQRYYRAMLEKDPELLALNVNRWFARAKDKNKLIRAEAGHVRAWLSDRYLRVANTDLAETLIPALREGNGNAWMIQEAAITDRQMHIRAIFPTFEADVNPRVGDVVHLGLTIRNSEVGAGAFTVEASLYRLKCTNTLVSGGGMRRVHLGSRLSGDFVAHLADETMRAQDRALMMEARDVVKALADRNHFEQLVGIAQGAAETELPEPIAATRILTKTAGLTEQETARVEEELTRAGDPTMWGLTNALTATARDLADFERKNELETKAGAILNDRRGWQAYKDATRETKTK